jgi:YfiH family protein
MNLGTQVGDDPLAVGRNRELLRTFLPADPSWLRQVHGTHVVEAVRAAEPAQADGCFARGPGRVCAVLVADCLPVLLCDRSASVVAAAHAGWRGLCAGVLEATVSALAVAPTDLLAYLGPGIGPSAFEVGSDVRDAFMAVDAAAAACFVPKLPATAGAPKWLCDLPGLARQRLHAVGVRQVFGGDQCTWSDARRFFSHRRDRRTGRQAALIWLEP